MPYLTGTLTGTYRHGLTNTPGVGTVRIIPSVKVLRDSNDGEIISEFPSTVIKIKPSDEGHFSVPVIAYNDPDIEPQHITYSVSATINKWRLPTVVGIRVDAGETVDISEVMSVDPEAPVYAIQVTRAELQEIAARVEEVADSALTAPDMAPVAFSGDYNDLRNLPDPPLGPGARYFNTFSFAAPQAEWIIQHNQNSYGFVVETFDLFGEPIEGTVQYDDPNTIRIEWYYPTAGEVRLFI